MKQCQHILCVIDPDARGEQVLQLAWEHARRHSASLLTAHVVDYHTGFESDHAPFMSPTELAAGLAEAASRRILSGPCLTVAALRGTFLADGLLFGSSHSRDKGRA